MCPHARTKVGHHAYWAVQAGLLTPLTFARHRLSPLAAFTSGACFLHNGRRWQWICEFYTANFKGHFWRPVVTICLATSNNLLLVHPKDAPNAFVPRNRDLLVSQKTTQRHFLPTLHPLSPVIFATATVVAFVLLRNSRFNFHKTISWIECRNSLASDWHRNGYDLNAYNNVRDILYNTDEN